MKTEPNSTCAHPNDDSTAEILRQFCVLVAASDRATDVFKITFKNADTIWRDVKWRRYVGFTSKHPDMLGFKSLPARSNAEWRGRVGDYLDDLPDEIRYVMLIVEDFLFTSPIDAVALNAIAERILQNDLSYVRMVPVPRNYLGRLLEYFRRMLDTRPFRPLAFSEPYYSSLEVSIWKRDYLRSLLRRPGTVWEFEHVVGNERHYAVWRPALNYVGLGAREKWNREASRLLAQQGTILEKSMREQQTVKYEFRRIRQRIVFEMIGFLSFRIRRYLSRIERN